MGNVPFLGSDEWWNGNGIWSLSLTIQQLMFHGWKVVIWSFSVVWNFRQGLSVRMMRMTMTQMMTSVMMKSYNHLLMRWIHLYSLWIRLKVRQTLKFDVFESNFIFVLLDLHATAPWITVMQASDPLRFQNLTQTLEFQYQALANGVAQHADQRRVEIEKEKMEKVSAAATQWLKNSMDMAVKKFWFAFWVYCLFYPFSDDLEKSIAGRVQSIFVGSMVRESLSVARDFPVCKCLELCVSKIPLVRHNTGTAACWGCSWGW